MAPFTEADINHIAALPVAEQVEGVCKEMMKRNPGFDGTLIPTIENGVVMRLEFSAQHVTDISPVRTFPRLTSLNCRADDSLVGMVSDLKPLKGMNLVIRIAENNCATWSVRPITRERDGYVAVTAPRDEPNVITRSYFLRSVSN